MKTFKEGTDVTGWMMAEKFDGVNARWDGEKLISRSGKTFNAPDWFIENLPPHECEGELWCDRGQFQKVADIVNVNRKANKGKKERKFFTTTSILDDCNNDSLLDSLTNPWHSITFIIFDSTAPTVCDPWITYCRWEPCNENMERFYEGVLADSGEGIVLKSPDGTLYKKKPVDTCECRVFCWLTGKGKFADGIAGRGPIMKLKLNIDTLKDITNQEHFEKNLAAQAWKLPRIPGSLIITKEGQ